jgi:hypothetical protein
MARSDDLVPLLKPDPGKAVGFRQGVISSWDPDTAENTVLVGGTLMTNLPILNTSEASLLTEGDVVGILTSGQTWAILGRFTYPATPEAVSAIQSITNRIQAAENIGNGSCTSTSYGDLTGTGVGPAVTIRIGSSGRALVLWSCEMGQVTNGGPIQYSYRVTPHVAVAVSGANTVAPSDWNALNLNLEHPGPGFAGEALSSVWIQTGTLHLFTGLDPGDTTFTLKYRHDGINPSAGAVSQFQAREIAVFAL